MQPASPDLLPGAHAVRGWQWTVLTGCEKQAGFLLIWLSVKGMHHCCCSDYSLCSTFISHQIGNTISMPSLWRGAERANLNDTDNSSCDQILMIELCGEPPVGLRLQRFRLSNFSGWKLIFFSASHLEDIEQPAIIALYLTAKSISLMNWLSRRGSETC